MTLEEAQRIVKEAAAAADPNSGKAWLLTEGVMGQGEKPGWFKGEKYKTVADQAAAYPELEKRFGGFTGAPKDGKYTFNPPDGVDFKADHPMAVEFTKWAAENQLSQAGYDQLLSQLIQYEMAQQPNMADIKARLGADADSRISNASAWVKANLGAEGFANFRMATTGANADAVFKMVEGLISKSGQVRLPPPGSDVAAATAGQGLEAIQAKFAERTPDGKLKIDAVAGYRAQVEKEMRDYFANMPEGTQYHGSRRT